jgi:hypothetical protein
MVRRARRATSRQLASYSAAAEKGAAADLRRQLDKELARGIQGFAIESMNTLAEIGPAWTGEFSASWGFAPAGVTPDTPGVTGQIYRYTKSDVPVRDIERFIKNGVTKFNIVNTSPHASIAIDEEEAKFIRPGNPSRPIDESKWVHGDAQPRPGIRYSIGRIVDENDPDANSSRTAPKDWFQTYLEGGGLQRDLKVGFKFGYEAAF